jgi:hypothetical protein
MYYHGNIWKDGPRTSSCAGCTDGVGTGNLSRNIWPRKSTSVPSNTKEGSLTCTSQGALYLSLSKEGASSMQTNHSTELCYVGGETKEETHVKFNNRIAATMSGAAKYSVSESQSVISLIRAYIDRRRGLVSKHEPQRGRKPRITRWRGPAPIYCYATLKHLFQSECHVD